MPERLRELTVPEGPFRPVDPIEQPGARLGGLTLMDRAARELVHMLPAHRDVKPIQHGFGLRRRRALNRAQSGIAVGEHGDARLGRRAALAEQTRDGLPATRAPLADEREPCRRAWVIQHLADDNFKGPLFELEATGAFARWACYPAGGLGVGFRLRGLISRRASSSRLRRRRRVERRRSNSVVIDRRDDPLARMAQVQRSRVDL